MVLQGDVRSVGSWLIAFVRDTLCDLEGRALSGLRLPPMLGGHLVRSDARADLVYVLGLLASHGLDDIAGVDLRALADESIRGLEPDDVEGFFAYRVAEGVNRLGGLAELSAHGREVAAAASASPRLWHQVVNDKASRRANFHIVAARCVWASEVLGLRVDRDLRRTLMKRSEALFAGAHRGWIDDGLKEFHHYDIYSPEMYLIAEPFSDEFRDPWEQGLAGLLADLQRVGHPRGLITWGRSVGPLALAMSIEMSALAAGRVPTESARWWSSLARESAAELEGWFASGLVAAHQFRSSDPYRGPARRLQLTFDLLGKLAWSALHLPPGWSASGERLRQTPADCLLGLPEGAAIWAYRSRALSFVLPLTGGASVDYLPSPRAPGSFEQPVAGFPLLVPTLVVPEAGRSSAAYVPAGPPAWVKHEKGVLDVHQDRWVNFDASDREIAAERTAHYRVDGRRLEVHEQLDVTNVPQGTTLAIIAGDTPERKARLEVKGLDSPRSISTAGIAEWQTHWGAVNRVHEVSAVVQSGQRLRFSWSVVSDMLVATAEPEHQYSRLLYAEVPETSFVPAGSEIEGLAERLRRADAIHIAWPERWPGIDVRATERAIAQIRSSSTPIIWTQHNVIPHGDQSAAARRVYELWAEAAGGVIHHSNYGKEKALNSYKYTTDRHYVIPHGDWSSLFPNVTPPRGVVEAEEGWISADIRLAVIGRPRRDKALQGVLDAFHRVSRDDMHLVARVSSDVRVPVGERISTLGHVGVDRYYRRLTAVDGIIMPFTGRSMLATGTAFDCIGGGIAPIALRWGFLEEVFGDSAVWYEEESLLSTLEGLTLDRLRTAGAAVRSLHSRHRWSDIGARTAQAIEEVVTA